jgi:hypothetical protein
MAQDVAGRDQPMDVAAVVRLARQGARFAARDCTGLAEAAMRQDAEAAAADEGRKGLAQVWAPLLGSASREAERDAEARKAKAELNPAALSP